MSNPGIFKQKHHTTEVLSFPQQNNLLSLQDLTILNAYGSEKLTEIQSQKNISPARLARTSSSLCYL